jgi:hypothetical protein
MFESLFPFTRYEVIMVEGYRPVLWIGEHEVEAGEFHIVDVVGWSPGAVHMGRFVLCMN